MRTKRPVAVDELGVRAEFVSGQLHEKLFVTGKIPLALAEVYPQLVVDFGVKILQELPAGAGHGLVDLRAQFQLQLVERRLDLLGRAAALVNGGDPLLEIDARLDGPQHFVAGPEDALEERELLGQQLEDALVGLVLPVEEIDDDHVVLLPVTVAAADALLDALRVPGEVVVHHQGAELEVDALRAGLGGDHDLPLLAEVVYQGRPHVGRLRPGNAVGAGMAFEPFRVDRPREGIGVRSVEQHDPLPVGAVGQDPLEILLGTTRFGKDDRLAGCTRRSASAKARPSAAKSAWPLAFCVIETASERNSSRSTISCRIAARSSAVSGSTTGEVVFPLFGGFLQRFVILIQFVFQGLFGSFLAIFACKRVMSVLSAPAIANVDEAKSFRSTSVISDRWLAGKACSCRGADSPTRVVQAVFVLGRRELLNHGVPA